MTSGCIIKDEGPKLQMPLTKAMIESWGYRHNCYKNCWVRGGEPLELHMFEPRNVQENEPCSFLIKLPHLVNGPVVAVSSVEDINAYAQLGAAMSTMHGHAVS